jgi:type IV secretion system protein VirD4
MVSRQETARPLLTPGEVMQLPPGDELVLVSGIPPIRARKARYYEDRRFTSRILAPSALTAPGAGGIGGRPVSRANDWTPLLDQDPDTATVDESAAASLTNHDRANGGIRREPALPRHEAVVPEEPKHDFDIGGFADELDEGTIVAREIDRKLHAVARQAALDRDDGLGI